MAKVLLSKQRITRGLSNLLIPIFFLISSLALVVIVSRIAFSRVSGQFKEIEALRIKNDAIEAKVEDLSVIASKTFADSEKILTSFPEEDPILWMLTQLRSHSEEYSLTISGQTVTFYNQSANDIGKTAISFNVVGDTSNINDFLLSFDGFAPISTFTKVVYNLENAGGKTAAVDAVIYFSKLPAQYPKIDQPVNNLTADEEKIVQRLSKMTPPAFTQITPNAPFELTDPF